MFLDLFYGLRGEKVPVSIQEWLALMTAMEKGLHGTSLLRFYHVSRACLVKSEAHHDAFDRVFSSVFRGIESTPEMHDELMEWLRTAKEFPPLTAEQLAMLKQLTSLELMDRLAQTLAEQKERHDGGDRWIGTGGRSPHGHSGTHPTGIRVGGAGRNRSAMKVAESRQYIGYRTDITLDTRQMMTALRKLRSLTRQGLQTELDVDRTIDETCRNAGEIELKFRAPRKNDVRLLLLLDVGGTMDPYTELVGRLLSALKQGNVLREFRFYYFHNCVYDRVYSHPWLRRQDSIPVQQLFRELDARWKLMLVGDAAMHPSELLAPWGSIDHGMAIESAGVDWLHTLRNHYGKSVWVNPDPPTQWGGHTTQVIGKIFPMFHLSVQGLEDAVRALVGARGKGEK